MRFFKLSCCVVWIGAVLTPVAQASLAELQRLRFSTDEQEVAEATRKNDLADQMLAEARLPEGFAADFLAMLETPEQGIIWQNYILQKLDGLYLHPDAAAQRVTILQALWGASRSPVPTFAGTAQMTLQRLHEQRPDVVDAAKLARHAKWVVVRVSYSNSDRLSALHVLAAVDLDAASTIARDWLMVEQTPLLLKTTAIAVLGQGALPDSDRKQIEPYLKHPDFRLRSAAQRVLR